jgi:hypothetical protein
MEWVAWVDEEYELPLVAPLALEHYLVTVLAPVANSDHLARLYVALGMIRAGAGRDQMLPPRCGSSAGTTSTDGM